MHKLFSHLRGFMFYEFDSYGSGPVDLTHYYYGCGDGDLFGSGQNWPSGDGIGFASAEHSGGGAIYSEPLNIDESRE